jgi:hypothetical protein
MFPKHNKKLPTLMLEMNRQLRNEHRRRWARRGGGFAQTGTLMPIPADDWTFAVKDQVTTSYSDCGATMRPGQLVNQPNPELAQVVMAGGRRRRQHSRRQRGGLCGCMRGGSRGTRRQRGGSSNGFSVNVESSVGGAGPNVAPVYAGVPCDARAGSPNPFNAAGLGADPRAPADLYSLTPNVMRGGAYSSGNAYDASCYRAPGSELPVYNAETAGFRFAPSTAAGAALPDGVTAYNEVVPYAARLGGGRRSRSIRRNRKNAKKSYRRKH